MNYQKSTPEKEDSVRLFAPGSIIGMLARSYVVVPKEPEPIKLDLKGKRKAFEDAVKRTKLARFENDETFGTWVKDLRQEGE